MYEQCVDKDRIARYSRRDIFNWKLAKSNLHSR